MKFQKTAGHPAKRTFQAIRIELNRELEEMCIRDRYWDALSDIMYYMDEPVADPAAIALYFLSKEAAQKVKVCLLYTSRCV